MKYVNFSTYKRRISNVLFKFSHIDLSEDFHSLNHSILLNKLKHYGISGCSHKLFL